jgi:hypothetical protein
MNKFYPKTVWLIFIFLPLNSLTLFSQNIGIGTTYPNTSAALDISNTSKGLLIPRMSSLGANCGAAFNGAYNDIAIGRQKHVQITARPGLAILQVISLAVMPIGPILVMAATKRSQRKCAGICFHYEAAAGDV